MKRLAMISVMALTFTACGAEQGPDGDATFDEDGVREAVLDLNADAKPADVDRVIVGMRDYCATTGNDMGFAIFLAMVDAGENPDYGIGLYEIGCPERLAEQRTHSN